MITFIPVEDLLPIRNAVLRGGKLTLDECRFPGDELSGSLHLGFYKDGVLASIATFHPQNFNGYDGQGYQLRGMATIEEFRGQGFGNLLLNFALAYLREKKANYIWCNARKKALRFYLTKGFEIISDEFEVGTIGPHYVLYLKIQ